MVEKNSKLEKLTGLFRQYGSAAVAFSGGVDSSFLLKAAHMALGDKAAAITIRSVFVPERELLEAEAFCKKHGIRHYILDADVLGIPGIPENPENRCYLCKKALFLKIISLADSLGISVVAEGSNLDDDRDFRPGHKAVEELGIRSPLREAGLTKQEIRELSLQMGLPTWNKPSFACLASRFPYGETLRGETLGMVEQAEQFLLDLGFSQMRVRIHGGCLARVEVPQEELDRAFGLRGRITEQFRQLGFTYTALDLNGFRSGSMNEVRKKHEK